MGALKFYNTAENSHHMCGRHDTTARPEAEELLFVPTVKCGVCGAMAASTNDVCTTVKIFEEEQFS